MRETYAVLREAVDILMQSTPAGINLSEIVEELEKIREISNIHHVHAWKLDDTQIHFECHADLREDLSMSQTDKIRSGMEDLLQNKFHIAHVTIQFEYNCCDQKNVIHH